MNHAQNYMHSVRLSQFIGYSEVSTALKKTLSRGENSFSIQRHCQDMYSSLC